VPLRVGLVAGESSGDLLGAGLIAAVRSKVPDARFEGVAGPQMEAAGCEKWADADTLSVMGLVEPLRHLPELLRLRRSLVARWRRSPPDVFVGIDSPDFNLGLEKSLKSAGIPTVHYVSPTIWAWRAGRIRKIRKAADCVLCLLPFEPALYEKHGMNAEFVGHPKATSLSPDIDVGTARRELGLPEDAKIVAILPGSRGSEVTRLAPVFASAAAKIAAREEPVHFVTPVARPRLRATVEQHYADQGIAGDVTLVDGRSIESMAAADVVLLASGTAALESAMLGKPTVAAYRVAALTAAVVRMFRLLKVGRFTLPNVLTGELIIPEFTQDEANAEAIAAEVSSLLDDGPRRESIRARFAKLRDQLALNTDERAANALIRTAAQS
jgi:lipid-A-disaccharide synthase